MKHLHIRGFIDGTVMRYRVYDNSKNFEDNWDEGIGTYNGLDCCCDAILNMPEKVQLIGFDVPGVNEKGIRNYRNHLEQTIEEHNSALIS